MREWSGRRAGRLRPLFRCDMCGAAVEYRGPVLPGSVFWCADCTGRVYCDEGSV